MYITSIRVDWKQKGDLATPQKNQIFVTWNVFPNSSIYRNNHCAL